MFQARSFLWLQLMIGVYPQSAWLAQRRAGRLVAGANWVTGPVPGFVERDLRKFLECGILALGFAGARCERCGKDLLVAYSCKGRGMCPGFTHGAWWRRRRTWWSMYFQQWQYGSGWWYFRSACATF